MSAKRKNEGGFNLDQTGLGGAKSRSESFVTFRNGHLQLDVRGYLRSEEGKKSVAKVIRLSRDIPRKPKEAKSDEHALPDGTPA
jgi:hypothetical protein